MIQEIKLLPYRTTEVIEFIFDKYTCEKIITRPNCYLMNILRNTKAKIVVSFDYKKNIMCVGGNKFNVLTNKEYLYKKVKGHNIEASCIYELSTHIRESASVENFWHHTTKAFLLELNGNKINYIN